MKRIGLVVHQGHSSAMAYAAKAAVFLAKAGIQTQAEEAAANALADVVAFSEAKEPPEIVLSLGGDGTLLRGAQFALHWDVPLMGINLGRVGFLTESEPEKLEDSLECLIEGEYTLEQRALLDVRTGKGQWLALNDVVVSRGGYARLITVNALVDGESAGRYVADGLIVATPTGSTGYSLSAGGPIISPSVDCMVITPICAHSLQHRPAVVPGDAHISLELGCDHEMCACLQVDGQNCASLYEGARVDVCRAGQKIRLIRTKQPRFFQLVRDKLTEWSQ